MKTENILIDGMEGLKRFGEGQGMKIANPKPGVITVEFESKDETTRFVLSFGATSLPVNVNGVNIIPNTKLDVAVLKVIPDAEA